MISVSNKTTRRASDHTRFSFYSPKDLDDFCQVLISRVWSPIIWQNGYRAKANFKAVRLIALDFDSGETTLDMIQKECEDFGLWYILATTKSHQVVKIKPDGTELAPHDRFRLILKAESTCHNREVYEYNMREFPRFWTCDSSCVDGARFFWPCKELVAHSKGATVQWRDFDEDYVPERQRFVHRAHKLRALGNLGIRPEWIDNILRGKTKVPRGERHKTLYKIGAAWQLLGFDLEDLENEIAKTSLIQINDEYGPEDVRRAISNGFQANEGVL